MLIQPYSEYIESCKEEHIEAALVGVTVAQMLAKNENGSNSYHILAWRSLFNKIPEKLISQAVLLERDKSGRTPVHWLTANRQLHWLAEEHRTEKLMLLLDDGKNTALQRAIAHGQTELIPTGLLTAVNLTYPNSKGYTGLHYAAQSSQLDKLPASVLTPENLGIRTEDIKLTVYHEAASNGVLNQLPSATLTLEALHLKDAEGFTVLHRAAEQGNLEQVPKVLLTIEALQWELNNGTTVLMLAEEKNILHQIPLLKDTLREMQTLTAAEKLRWVNVLTVYGILPEVRNILEMDMSHLQKLGGWAGL